jgi:hypothetical protein
MRADNNRQVLRPSPPHLDILQSVPRVGTEAHFLSRGEAVLRAIVSASSESDGHLPLQYIYTLFQNKETESFRKFQEQSPSPITLLIFSLIFSPIRQDWSGSGVSHAKLLKIKP